MADFGDRLADYADVAERIRTFREKFPTGSLQPADLSEPFRLVCVADQEFVVYVAACYRTPDDARPGIGVAWEPVPGTTTFTRNSELQNAETAAWGRAIVAALVADAKKIASVDEIRARTDPPAPGAVREPRTWQEIEALKARAAALATAGVNVAGARAEAELPTIARANRRQLDAWTVLIAELEAANETQSA